MKIEKSSGSKAIDTRLVTKAVKSILNAAEDWEAAKYEVVKLLATMNENEREDWLDQVKEKSGVGLNLFRRMVAVAARGWVEARHLYQDYGLISHVDIYCASEKAGKILTNPNAELLLTCADGNVVKRQLCKMSRSEIKQAWNNQRGQVMPEAQKVQSRKSKQLTHLDGAAKVVKAKKTAEGVEVTVEGYSRPVILTNKDVKNFISMVI